MIYALKNDTRIDISSKYETCENIILSGARGETVFAELVLATEKPLYANKIYLTDFCGEKNRFLPQYEIYFAENIKIVHESCSYGGVGVYPEVLVPAKAYLSNCNAGGGKFTRLIVFSFVLPRNTECGKYFGKITAEADGKAESLDIELTVYDFELPKKNNAKSAFAVWYDNERIIKNDLSIPPMGESYDEYAKYFDLLKKFRISATELPVRSATDNSHCAACNSNIRPFEPRRGIMPQDLPFFIDAVKKYAADDSVSCYSLPYDVILQNGVPNIDTESLYRLFTELAKESSATLDLFEKAYLYITFIDEPTQEMLPLVRKVTEDVRGVMLRVADDCDFTGKENVKCSLLSVENVVPSWPEEKIYGGVDTFCPTFAGWHAPEFVRGMRAMCELGAKNWWYGCVSPWYPFPSYHIDEPLLGARGEGFLRYLFGVEGNLYWAVNSDRYFDEESQSMKYYDVYGGEMPWSQSNGEGLLVFDGKKFGVDGPLASLRLAAVCEAHQDYEYCLLLDKSIRDLCLDYDLNYDAREYMRMSFERVFYGTALIDESKFFSVREELARNIEAAQSGVMSIIESVDPMKKTAVVALYCDSQADVLCDDELIESASAGIGRVYRYALPLESADTYFTAKVIGKGKTVPVKRFVSPPIYGISLDGIKSDGCIRKTVRGEKTIYKTRKFSNENAPCLKICGKFDFSKLDSFILETVSLSDEAFTVSAVITDGTGKSFDVGYCVAEKGICRNRIHFNPTMQLNGFRETRHTTAFSHYTSELAELNRINISDITEIKFEIQNIREFCSLTPRQLKFSEYAFCIKSLSYTVSSDEKLHSYDFLEKLETGRCEK